MSRPVLALGSLFVGLAICLAPLRGQTTGPTTRSASTSTAPTTAPEPMVDNPHYRAWSRFEPGARVELDLNLRAGGQKVPTTITLTLQEVTPEKVIVQSVTRMTVPGLPEAQEHTQEQVFPAEVPQSQAEMADLPPGATGESRELGIETIEVNGRRYDARVHRFRGTIQEQPVEGKIWRSDGVPGGLVKMESTGPNMKFEMLLKSVTLAP